MLNNNGDDVFFFFMSGILDLDRKKIIKKGEKAFWLGGNARQERGCFIWKEVTR